MAVVPVGWLECGEAVRDVDQIVTGGVSYRRPILKSRIMSEIISDVLYNSWYVGLQGIGYIQAHFIQSLWEYQSTIQPKNVMKLPSQREAFQVA